MLLDTTEAWMNWLGHFHPLVVHLPIGILVVVFILEFVQSKAKTTSLNPAISISLAAGFIMAVISCVFGWFLANEGGYEETTLALHRWMGISLAFITGVGWLLHRKAGNKKVYKTLLFVLFVLLMLTGHLGGNMTHGEDYLTAGLPQPMAGWLGQQPKKDSFVKKEIANVNEAFVYADLVEPILRQRCYCCHSSAKVKGSLRMDTESLLFKGGKHGPVIQPGNAAASELVKRLLLPMEDDKRMPPKDKEPITPQEIELLRWWINKGADTKKKVTDLQPDSATKVMLKTFASGASVDTFKQAPLSKVFALQPTAAKQSDIDALTKLNIIVHPLAQNKTLLEISCVNFKDFDNNAASLLLKLPDNIVFLELNDTKITDEAMTQIAQLKNLVRLNLAGTNITSAGISKLKGLVNLEYLNITGTKVSDDGLQALSSMPLLKNVYCWKAAVTPAGIQQFKMKAPNVQVDAGDL